MGYLNPSQDSAQSRGESNHRSLYSKNKEVVLGEATAGASGLL